MTLASLIGTMDVDGVTVFFVWWSVWSLLDTYLLRLTPIAELVVLSLCACVKAAPFAARAVRSRWDAGQKILKETLDTV